MLLAALSLLITPSPGDRVLWSIGQTDGKAAEFRLAAGGFAEYREDPIHFVGSSREGDWPYVLPGPSDDWAKNGRHRGEIYFGLKGVAFDVKARLTVDLADTHPSSPPQFQLFVNGSHIADWHSPKGAGDDLILGRRATGKASTWTVEIPAGKLKNGNNSIALWNHHGSWAVFDAVRLEGSETLETIPLQSEVDLVAQAPRQAILRTKEGPRQPVGFEVTRIGAATPAKITVKGALPQYVVLKPGRQTFEIGIPPLKKVENVSVAVTAGPLTEKFNLILQPVRPWTVYLFPHSHVDIGYTDIQTFIEQLHKRNLTDAIEVARESRLNPHDSKFRFNVEATWVLDRYLQTATPEQRTTVVKAIREKTLAISGGYANLLTGVMHPEELMQSFRYSRILQERLGLEFDTVSQTDVPGMTWGNLTALNEAGIENLVLMPNAGDRTGGVHRAWQDRPFYWVGPSGREKVLVWQTDPYSVGVGAGWDGDRTKIYRTDDPSGRFIENVIFPKLDRLLQNLYPYDIVGEPWSFIDNSPIDGDVPKAAKAWNEKYLYPRVVLSTLSDACRELTRRYGAKLPAIKGDYTPYWEDGTGSSAAETAENRATTNRLIQAETQFALTNPNDYPAEEFLEAWRNVLLYSEHTWGAYNSTSEPDSDFVKAQWTIKKGFADTAERMSKSLLRRSTPAPSGAIEIRNTNSWSRTDLVRLSAELTQAGDRVESEGGAPVPSQRLKTGELAVLVRDLPAFGSRRLKIGPGEAFVEGQAGAAGSTLRSPEYEILLDGETGAVASLRSRTLGKELAAAPLNQFLYLPGSELKGLEKNRAPRIETIEPGPLVASIRVTSDAPGAKSLEQEITLVAGLDRVDLRNTLDKLPIREKEGVHFAFPFAVPSGQVRIDAPWALVRPDADQINGANKNWFTTQGYVDVSNAAFGVTCASLDAPLLEVGEISANLLGSQWNPDTWRQFVGPTQTFYSWALNNHWHTNYRADQEGLLTFRYRLQAHGAFQADAASRLATGAQQPLLVAGGTTPVKPILTVSDPTVLVTRLTPSDDGKAFIVRLWAASAESKSVQLRWRSDLGAVTRTDLSQKPGTKLGERVEVPGWGVVTVRVERKRD
ncbi:hypothetical protein EON81_11895 [bacterium]|nr:MAG: hypothetical protein EON81_11895 [bacterium]